MTHDAVSAREQVARAERAFARTMAERDFDAFTSFLSEEAVFFSGPQALRGKAAVADYWRRFFRDPAPSFSWEPERVAVLDSGDLALSTGPVHDAEGKVIRIFTSVWRREPEGWRVVFDKDD